MCVGARGPRRFAAKTGLVITAALLTACGSSPTLDIPAANAALEDPRGLSFPRRVAIDLFLDANAWYGAHSGYVAVFARDGRVVHASTSGYADIESETPMGLDTRFRLASMTKPVTAAAALILIEEGRLDLADPVSRYVPSAGDVRVAASHEFDAHGEIPTVALERPLVVSDLLLFSSGIGADGDPSDIGRLWDARNIYHGEGTLADRVERIFGAPLYEQPGERWRYGWNADVLARVVEVAAGQPFDAFLRERIFAPLGMDSTSFLPPASERGGIATMYTQDEGRDLVRVDLPASDAESWTPGGSGLVSTAGDYMRFALMLWNRGAYDGVRILSPEIVDAMTRPHVESGVLLDRGMTGLGWGLGLAVVVDDTGTPTPDRTGDYWWSGYYGTTFFVSPATGFVGVVMTQNQPGPHSPLPYAIYIAPAFAMLGQ